ncbi:hypothetical protein [Mycobacterium sp. 1245801.1]|uniref:hypothetical protein n=1 Tax=Mycobacterium sp. 1245801.1 TaxID=1834075 RepID=UPI000801C680|nr:hypothetical protein [Mycobacterium sp. 1245801.1]OBJ24469.1 hypothetical protein A5622_11825 [Mycobacterium sp. 1245801.1]
MPDIEAKQFFGELAVFVATHSSQGKKLPKSQWHPHISDGRFGECYEGDSAGARELAADLLAAADAYDVLATELNLT